MRPDQQKILSLVEQARGCLAVAMRESQGFEEEDVITLALAAVEEVLDEIEGQRDGDGLHAAHVSAAGSTDQIGPDTPPLKAVGRRGNCASGVRPAPGGGEASPTGRGGRIGTAALPDTSKRPITSSLCVSEKGTPGGGFISTTFRSMTGVQALLSCVRSRFGRILPMKVVMTRPRGQGAGGRS